jgi:hypothetical protein
MASMRIRSKSESVASPPTPPDRCVDAIFTLRSLFSSRSLYGSKRRKRRAIQRNLHSKRIIESSTDFRLF